MAGFSSQENYWFFFFTTISDTYMDIPVLVLNMNIKRWVCEVLCHVNGMAFCTRIAGFKAYITKNVCFNMVWINLA
jgi:hypothetical protein